MSWLVYWDNGNGACGTFPQTFELWEDADDWGQDWAAEANLRDGVDLEEEEGYSYDVVEGVQA